MGKRIRNAKTKLDVNRVLTLVEMEYYLSAYFDFRRNIIVPNISWGLSRMHECDLFIIRKTGYVIEVEIKRSLADFKKDFTKKHDHSDNRIKDFYYALPLKIYEKSEVVIESLLPENAGLLLVAGNGRVSMVKKSISNKKARALTDKEINKVMQLGCMRVWALKQKLMKYESNCS